MKKLSLLLLMMMFIGGCAAQSHNMVCDKIETSKKHPYSIEVAVDGGRETNPLWTSQISNSEFTQAIETSILNSDIFKSIAKGDNADYYLNVDIVKISQPIIGLDFDIAMETKWALIQKTTKTIVWSDKIATTYKAKLGTALIAGERLQKANEGSARENIKEGLSRLSQVDF